jgi:hypothetical protein
LGWRALGLYVLSILYSATFVTLLRTKKVAVMEGRIVIVAYKPKTGKSEALQQLMREHLFILRQQQLVTDRDSVMMEAKDGTIIEVFEWKSKAAIERAHSNTEMLKMWKKYSDVCDYIPIATVDEASQLFSEFTPFA